MIELIQAHSKEAFALGVVVFGFLLNRIFRLRPRLNYSVRHASNYVVDQPLLDGEGKVVLPQQVVRTASIVSENAGLLAAKNVEFTFNWKPPIYTVFPGRAFQAEDTSMGRWCIRLDSLAPGEVFGIEIMSINLDLPLLSSMRAEETVGELITMVPQRDYPAWFNRSVGVLLILGLGTALYWIALLVEWLAS